MTGAFEGAFEYTVGNEGGYTNDKFDSGGPTNWGITIADLSEFLGRAASVDEVKNMTKFTAKQIYEKKYWNPLSLDRVESGAKAICIFDIGVVRGIGVPPIYAQQICGVTVDGHIGPITLSAINAMDDRTFITQFSRKTRNGFLAIVGRRPTQARFLKGWLNRANRLLTLIPKAAA